MSRIQKKKKDEERIKKEAETLRLKEWEQKFDLEQREREERERIKDERLRQKEEELRLKRHNQDNDFDEEAPFKVENLDINRSKKN